MNSGMLWYDNDPHTALAVKVARAADYYRQKYGHAPNVCLVNPAMLAEIRPDFPGGRAGNVIIRPNRSILVGHLWIGNEM